MLTFDNESGGNAKYSAPPIMTPTKAGQTAKFHTPLPDEDPDQLYVIVEVIDDVDRPRALIKALNTGLDFPPVNTVLLKDLEIAAVNTSDLIGYTATILKPDNSRVTGAVIRVNETQLVPDLSKDDDGIRTNCLVTVKDRNGTEHTGTLFVL